MANQLVYTSSPRGLKPGAFGFCVVACTRGMKEQTASALEALSGYRRVYAEPQSALRNPVACSHVLFDTPTGRLRVLARVADAGLDYSGRTNKIASFFDVAANELVAPGPAALFSQPGLFVSRWSASDAPRYFETPTTLPNVVAIPRGCDEWRRATGSSAWAGVLAATVATRQPVTLVARPDQNVLRLFQEAIALLSPAERWNATFSTYYMKAPPGVVCQWKAVMQGSPEEAALRSTPGALTINLTNPALLPNPDSLATTPQARQLVAAAVGFASSDAFQRPASGKLPGATPSALPGAAPIGVPGVAGIPEQRGEGYALQPQEVAVPNGAPGRKKLNYGRDAVLKVNVPKTRKASSKSLISKLLIYVSVALLLLLSLAMVLWLKGPLKNLFMGIDARKEAVEEVNGVPESQRPELGDGNWPGPPQGFPPRHDGPGGFHPGNFGFGNPPHLQDDKSHEREYFGTESGENAFQTDSGEAEGQKISDDSEDEELEREKSIAEEINSALDQFAEERDSRKKAASLKDLRETIDPLFNNSRGKAKSSELKKAFVRYECFCYFEFTDDLVWTPVEIKEKNASGIFLEGKILYSAVERFFLTQIGEKSLTVKIDDQFNPVVTADILEGDERQSFGGSDVKFFVDRRKKKAGLWFKTRDKMLDYWGKRMRLEASYDDSPVYESREFPLVRFEPPRSESGDALDLKWLSVGDKTPEIQNVTPKRDTLYCDVVDQGTYSFTERSREDREYALSQLTEDQRKRPENITILDCVSEKDKKKYYIVFSFEKEDLNLVGKVCEIRKIGLNANREELWSKVDKLPNCRELRFNVRLRTEDSNKNSLTVGHIKVPLRSEEEQKQQR